MIEFEHVFKSFKKGERVICLRDAIPNLFKKTTEFAFWALQDVSFNVAKGETVSIIGPNGAGKSTILKIIAGIMKPNKGKVKVNGRVSALIEVGAGFHPDLTGRENIYLNGTIMGMSRKEINEKFDSIVDFAGFSKFLDTPVKRYSSGMYLRLGFAVAAHIEPDVLLIDEVLAVGDISFQAKCLEKIKALKDSNTTIIFVSHNLGAVNKLCNRTILLSNGNIRYIGNTSTAIDIYRKEIYVDKTLYHYAKHHLIELIDVKIFNANYQETTIFTTGEPLTIRIHFIAHVVIKNPVITIGIYATDGIICSACRSDYDNFKIDYLEGQGYIEVKFTTFNLLPNSFLLSIGIWEESCIAPFDWHQKAYSFEVKGGKPIEGICHLPHTWYISKG